MNHSTAGFTESAIRILMSPLSWTSLPPPTPSHLSRSSQSTRLSSWCYIASFHKLPISPVIMYMFQCYFGHLDKAVYSIFWVPWHTDNCAGKLYKYRGSRINPDSLPLSQHLHHLPLLHSSLTFCSFSAVLTPAPPAFGQLLRLPALVLGSWFLLLPLPWMPFSKSPYNWFLFILQALV